MADPSLLIAVSRGIRPAEIVGAVAHARTKQNQLVATNQIADRNTFVTLAAAHALQSPSIVNIFA